MREIKKENILVAIVFDGTFEEGTKPLTGAVFSLQALAFRHPKGRIFPAHFHKPQRRVTENLMEALVIFSGKIRVDVYYEKEIVESVELSGGEGIIIVNGGIGAEVLEDAAMMEFKNGPFLEDKVLL